MELPNDFADNWKGIVRDAAVDLFENLSDIEQKSTIKAYFKTNKNGGSYWLEIQEPRADIRLIDIEVQREIRPLTVRARIWYYTGKSSLAKQHIELGIVLLGEEETKCGAKKPRPSWAKQLVNAGVEVEGVEYPLRKVSFLSNKGELGLAIKAILNDLWHISLHIRDGSAKSSKFLFPDEIDELDEILNEGAVSSVSVNRYERNRKARELCLEHYGMECRVCGMDFGRHYGKIGVGFMHVHHTVELSTIRKEYTVDPIRDLVPVCPNCHSMLHQRKPPYTIEELREIYIN
jgi:hypothetical protein